MSRHSGGPVAAILLLTGAAGLVYQVAWHRYLGILTGVDHAATAATLAVFLGGLSLGYALCGDLSSRSSRPLATYAWREVAIGLRGLAFPWTFSATESLARGWSFSPPYGVIAGSLGAAMPLILVPALLMGATVTFMTRGLAFSRSGLTATHAPVYGLNTLGAVAGTIGAGFAIVPAWGPGVAVRLAAALNLVAAAILFALPRTRVAAIAVGSLAVARLPAIPPKALFLTCAGSSVVWLALFPTYDAWPWLAHAMRFAAGGEGLGFGADYTVVGIVLLAALFLAVAPMGAEGRARARWAARPEVRASLAELGIADFDALWARRIPAFPDYAARAMFEGAILKEDDVLGAGGNPDDAPREVR